MERVDLNCDMGESFGAWSLGADEAVLPWVTSANVACGFHGGDPAVMRRTVRSALARGVAVGAHPGLQDLAGFGRRAMGISPDETYELVLYQVGALAGFAHAAGVRLSHVKPHGALYNMAARNASLADAIATAVRDFDPGLTLFGLAGSELVAAGERAGLLTAAEVFADRNYEADGSLVPRNRPDALLADAGAVVPRVVRMVREGRVASVSGADLAVRADTVCVHGDGPRVAEIARALRTGLEAEGITVAAPGARAHAG